MGLAPETLRDGRDLVLEPGWADGLALPDGTALEDHLEIAEREAVDEDARAALARWRQRSGPLLTVDAIDLAHIAEVELLARCFVPVARLDHALPAVLRTYATTAVASTGGSDGLVGVALALAAKHGMAVDPGALGDGGSPQQFRWRGFGLASVAARAGVRRLGVPPRLRGGVVCVPYWHLVPLYRRLARSSRSLGPVAAGVALPALGRRDALGVAVRGGWLGAPGARARRRSQETVDAALALARAAGPEDAVDAAVHALALDVVRAIAGDALAEVAHARAGLAGGRARLLVLPWDSPAAARVLLAAAAATDVPSLVVQHGFDAGLGDPDKLLAGHIATWSARDSEDVTRRGRKPDEHTITGNPGATHLAAAHPRTADRDRTIVLVEYPGRLSARLGSRACMRQAATALRGLAAARPGTTAVVRPHPADPSPEAYGALGAGLDLNVTVDAHTPIETLLRTADLVVGAVSTASLQAIALGVPVGYLDLGGFARPWPFDGAPDGLPRATSAEELAAVAADLVAGRDVPALDVAREALGARPDAIERCVALVGALAA